MNKIIHYLLIILISSMPLLMTSFFLFMKDPPVWPDEPVFFDMAKNLLATGRLHANIYSGAVVDVGVSGLGYPPLYFMLLGKWISFFGSSIEQIRFFSLLVGFLSIVIFFFILKMFFNNNFYVVFGSMVLALNPQFSGATRFGRMEILTLFFLLLAFLFLCLAHKKQRNYFYLISGISCGLAAMSHPMGYISVVIISLSSLIIAGDIKAKIIRLIMIILPVLVFTLWWLLAFVDNLGSLLITYRALIADKAPKLPYIIVLFQTDFSWWFLFILEFIFFFIFLVFLIKRRERNYMSVFIAVIISIAGFIYGKEGCYILYFHPFIIIAMLIAFSYIQKLKNKSVKLIYYLFVFLLIVSYVNLLILSNNNIGITRYNLKSLWDAKYYDYHKYTKQIISILPKNEKMNIFIAAVPDPYFDLKENKLFGFYEAPDPDFPISEVKYRKDLDDSDYAVITWIPQQFLKDYIEKNRKEVISLGRQDEYSALVIKFVPRDKRQ